MGGESEDPLERIEREVRDIRHSLQGSDYGYPGVYRRLNQIEADVGELKVWRRAIGIALGITGLTTSAGLLTFLTQLFGGG